MESIKIGVIGLGNMGRHHARIYHELSAVRNSELYAVSDEDSVVGKDIAKKYSAHFDKDYRKMLSKQDVDLLSIAVPTRLHKEVTLDAINSGVKYILLEKPIANDLESAYEIIHSAEKNKTNLMIGHLERFNPAIEKLRKIVCAPKRELGDIVTIKTERIGLPPADIKDNNLLIDLAVHDIDIIGYLTAEKPKLRYVSGRSYLGGGIEDTIVMALSYGPVQANIHVSWSTPIKRRKLNLAGTRGYAELDYQDQSLRIFKPEHFKKSLEFKDFQQYSREYSPTEPLDIIVEKEEPLRLELGYMLDTVKYHKKVFMSPREGVTALATALEALSRI